MQFRTLFFTAAFCAFTLVQAEARTLYVNANRPNNKGNGLKLATAKKTIQAAINIAKSGDTIIVYPGIYAPIKTKNKKITIKSKSGCLQTVIQGTNVKTFVDMGSGNATKLSGIWVMTTFYEGGDYVYMSRAAACKGGTVQNSVFFYCGGGGTATFVKSKLTTCVLGACCADTTGKAFAKGVTFNRCSIKQDGEKDKVGALSSCSLYNTLIADCTSPSLSSCTLMNCTLAENSGLALSKSKAYNTIFYKVAASQFKSGRKNKLYNCYKGASPKFKSLKKTALDENGEEDVIQGDYTLMAGSPCINKGKLTKAQKKLVGSKDLSGNKRIKGKAIDIGCYER